MFIYRNLYYSAIAASGKGSSLLRVLGSLQKLLLSQRRDGRLNNHFSITVTMWEQLFASEGMPAIVSDVQKPRRKERRRGGRGRWKESFFLLHSVLLRVLILILPADLQMYVPRHLHKYLHPSVDAWAQTHTHTHWCTLNRTWIFLCQSYSCLTLQNIKYWTYDLLWWFLLFWLHLCFTI